MAQGFQPGAAALNMASGGAFGFIKNLVSPKPQPPKAPEEKPQTPPQQAAPAPNTIAGYAGMTAMQRREKEAGLKNGGDLKTGQGGHVPGTGSGDKIPAKYEPGEFVVSNAMLAANPGMREQLHAVREKVLAAQGRTPAQADAKNAGVIAKLSAKSAANQPSLGFAAGGAIDDEEKKRMAAQSAMYVAGAQANAASQPAPAMPPPVATAKPEPAQTASPTVFPGARAVMSGVGDDVSSNIKAGNYAQAAGNVTRGALAMVPAVADDVVGGFGRGAYNLAAKPVGDFGRAVVGSPANAAEAPAKPATMPTAPVAPPTVASPDANAPGVQTDVQRGGATAMANPNPNQINVIRQPNGVMSFSGGPNIGKDGGDISYNAGASGFKPSGAGVTVVPGKSIGSASPSTDAALSAARFAAADRGDFAAVRDSYNAQGQSFGGETKESVAADRLKELALSPRGTPGRKAALGLYRDQMAANTAGKAQDAAAKLAQQKLGLDTQELGLKQTAAGFQNRAAKQLEDAQSAFANAKTDVEREKAQDTLRALQGKYEKATPELWDKVQTGVDPRTNAPIYSLYNKRTGESPGQQNTADAPTTKEQYDKLPKGARYTAPDGKILIKG